MPAISTFVSGIPTGLANLVETNRLSRIIADSLGVNGRYRQDVRREKLPQGQGGTLSFTRLGKFDVDLKPIEALGDVPQGAYSTELYTASPRPYANAFAWDSPSAYVQIGDRMEQGLTRLGEWAGRTSSRIARGKLFSAYLSGQAVIRRAQTTSDSVLLVDSLAGFRSKLVNGAPVAVSATTPIDVTIVALTTFTAQVTGVTPFDPLFPDGPGQLTLSTTLSAAVAANSYVYATNQRSKIVRPNNRASTEALLVTDIPTLQDLITMRTIMQDRGVPMHPDGTYHGFVDPWFFANIVQDSKWSQAFQSQGINPIFGPGSQFSPNLMLTLISTNDSPALGKGAEIVFGSAGSTIGATGAPGSAKNMADIGIPVVNSSGVKIRRIIMTGDETMFESFVSDIDLIALTGGKLIHQINSNFGIVEMGSTRMALGNIDGWTVIVRPPMDARARVATVSISNTFDLVCGTDSTSIADTSDTAPLKRAVVMEFGSAN